MKQVTAVKITTVKITAVKTPLKRYSTIKYLIGKLGRIPQSRMEINRLSSICSESFQIKSALKQFLAALRSLKSY